MKTYQRAYLILAVTFLAMVTVCASAQTNLPAEDDTWITGNNTKVNFPDFNIDLSTILGGTPNQTQVFFNGVPLDQSNIGLADTLLSRGQPTINGNNLTASLSLKGLHLASSQDITVQTTDHGAVGYHVDVTLSNQNGGGRLDLSQTSSDGGTYNSHFDVTPVFTFTNTTDPSQPPIVIDCGGPTYNCTFPLMGSGNWLYTSTSGFDPASQGIPIVPSGVHLGGYVTQGRKRFGGIQVGCGGTRAAGYHCNSQDQNDELHGILGQANGHDVKPANDCASSSNTTPSNPSPTKPSSRTGSAMSSSTTTTNPTPVAICAATL
ncbi:MAG TPA: hypothetical protein VI685_12105 [Candidatus Angelobacter sp.]